MTKKSNRPTRTPPRKLITTRPVPRATPPIDRIGAWLGRQSRLVRTLLSSGVATVLTIALALILFGTLFNTVPDRLTFGPFNANNLPFILFVFLVVAGILFYWVGWRVLIGFDFEETALNPGRAGALWVMLGGAVLIAVILLGGAALISAVQN